ncbi:sulfite exporter TauE/SafE family protein [Shimia sp. R10_1]|uniref:sulfite exporter TauE/SafE family protein n=1 Tax=Shimia sp. R10_1 TaxID=2821095 RepID=UPI001ADD1FD2|nr:sulfite exporter TauE/SafE family protein [Shimia sp. R10_1]MBO9473871.1 sulfite exporter TauE/SafE family protein [Shimia sp. R10_1]
MIAFLPPELAQSAAIILLATSFLGSFITAAFGIGGGVAFLAACALLLPPAAIIPVHGVVQLGSNAIRAIMFLRHLIWTALPAFVVGSLIGVAIGGSVVVSLPGWLVQSVVGVFILWVVFAKPPKWLSRWPLVTGLMSSFLTMFFGATGPFVAGYVKTLQLDRHTHVATQAALMTVQHGLKVAIFGLLGFAFADWAVLMAGLIACGALGTWIGKQVLGRMSDHGFHRILNIILVLLALRLIWGGVSAFL